ncbi:MAG: hypothetical protein AAF195_03915 [Pseudomonadota bacterium]
MKNKKKLSWILLFIALILMLLIEVFFYKIPDKALYFEKIVFFHAWFGLTICVILILISKILQYILHRKENYYHNNNHNNETKNN